ncbi:MAG TPA: glycosyltransferase [Terriglobia bacterium]|nr:glycosyltransferase [Terriglobia bacterium]
MTKLLILSSDTGEGHNSAAAAIEDAARTAGLSVKIRKPLEESTRVNRSLANFYNILLTHRPQWMGWYFRLIDGARPNERDFFYSKVRRYVGRFIESESPDILLSVHPMLNHFIQRYIGEERLGIPRYTFLTDPFPPFWRGWTSPYIDRYFVATDEALQALTASGIPAWRIERVSMPVRPGFAPATMTEIEQFRSTLELGGASTILINGGARGGGPILPIYETIRSAAASSNILVVCGRNSGLRWRIDRLKDRKTRTFGFLEDIHRYVAASDLVVTKPGALSAYEALACGVPVLFIGMRALMPQESGLFHAAAHYDFGFAANTLQELAAVIRKGPGEWNRKREAIPQFYQAGTGKELVERIQPVHV